MTRIFRRQRGADDGVALVTVMVTMLVLTVFVAAALTFSVNSRVVSRNSQDTGAAISVAQAGVDDFVKQLNLDLERLGDLGLNTWSDWRSVGRDATQQYRYRVVSSSNGVVNVEHGYAFGYVTRHLGNHDRAISLADTVEACLAATG